MINNESGIRRTIVSDISRRKEEIIDEGKR
nr:MAG TPA: hypothetical protein [Caudoviricetes sp.]